MTSKIKWLVFAFAVSLSLNVFVAGLVIGRGFRPPPPPRDQPNVGFNIKKLNKYLSPTDRRKFGKSLAEQREHLRLKFREMKSTERQIEQLIIAEEVDFEALQAALELRETYMRQLQMPMRRIVVEAIYGLDRKSRIEFAADIFKGGPNARRQSRRERGDDRPDDRPRDQPRDQSRDHPPEGRQ